MPEHLLTMMAKYGYIAIIALVFLQEVGIPNPIPNELVLAFSGYLCFTGVLNISLVILSAMVGDLLASLIIFELFFFFGTYLMKRKPKWLPISHEKLDRFSHRIQVTSQTSMFIGRLTPFIKGYVSVISGLMRVPQKKYGFTLLATSFIWSSAYVVGGYFIGPHLNKIAKNFSNMPVLMIVIPSTILMIAFLIHLFKKKLLA